MFPNLFGVFSSSFLSLSCLSFWPYVPEVPSVAGFQVREELTRPGDFLAQRMEPAPYLLPLRRASAPVGACGSSSWLSLGFFPTLEWTGVWVSCRYPSSESLAVPRLALPTLLHLRSVSHKSCSHLYPQLLRKEPPHVMFFKLTLLSTHHALGPFGLSGCQTFPVTDYSEPPVFLKPYCVPVAVLCLHTQQSV